MIRNIKIQCPECHDTCELYLSTSAPIVILNCPNCWTPMMYNENGVFVLSENQLSELAKNSEFSISNLLDRFSGHESAEMKMGSADHDDPFAPPSTTISTSSPPAGYDVREVITGDDIVDLRIELATCKDSLDFISRM